MAAFDTVNGPPIGEAHKRQSARWPYGLLGVLLAAGLFQLVRPATGDYLGFVDDTVWVCPALGDTPSPEHIDRSACELRSENEIDTYRQQLWVLGALHPPAGLVGGRQPLGLYLSARASSRVYLNGTLLGRNGEPGPSATAETIGNFDAVFYVPKHLLQAGANSIAVLLSGQHSVLDVRPGVLMFGFRAYREAPHHGRDSYWIALLTFGGFFIGAVYFGVAARQGTARVTSTALSVGSALAALQLLVEVSRGFWAYPYPLHDVRQLLVSTLSFGVGASLVSHTFASLRIPRQRSALAISAAVAVAGLFFLSGYEAKASWLMFVPSITAGLAALACHTVDRKTSLAHAGAFVAFASVIVLDPDQFLDVYYYVLLLIFMSVLFAYQARAYRLARRERQVSEAARMQLEAALADVAADSVTFLTIAHAGKTEKIDCKDIAVVSAAGDYVVIRLLGGREIVQGQSLKALSEQLPKYFVAVHRSHRVNSRLLADLKRQPSGGGELTLQDGHTVPVSRRVFPRVKKSLFAE